MLSTAVMPVADPAEEKNIFVHVGVEYYLIIVLTFLQQKYPAVTLPQIYTIFIIILQKLLYFNHLCILTTLEFQLLTHHQRIIDPHLQHHNTILIQHKYNPISKIFYISDPHLLTKGLHKILIIKLGQGQIIPECCELIVDKGVVRYRCHFGLMVTCVVYLLTVVQQKIIGFVGG